MLKKRNLGADLKQVAGVLQSEKICLDISPINRAISGLKTGFCNIQDLRFKIDNVPNNTRPSVNFLDVLLNVNIKEERCLNNYTICNNVGENYNFSVQISGKDGDKTVYSSWHLDLDNSFESEYVHPLFHFTYGGKSLKGKDLGDLILLPTPRIAFPPMDAFLGIDFILSNFLKKNKYNKIKANTNYYAAVKRSQSQFWQPYMLSLARHWCEFKNCNHYTADTTLSELYFPTLIK